MNRGELIEKLAAQAHTSWAGWMQYLFQFCTENPDGTVTLRSDKVARWKRQMNTNYENLPEEEKRSDREEAKPILGLLDAYIGPLGWSKLRRFKAVRHRDFTGVSGTGLVAEGVYNIETDKVVIFWSTAVRSMVIYESLDDLHSIMGHGGATEFVWVDSEVPYLPLHQEVPAPEQEPAWHKFTAQVDTVRGFAVEPPDEEITTWLGLTQEELASIESSNKASGQMQQVDKEITTRLG